MEPSGACGCGCPSPPGPSFQPQMESSGSIPYKQYHRGSFQSPFPHHLLMSDRARDQQLANIFQRRRVLQLAGRSPQLLMRQRRKRMGLDPLDYRKVWEKEDRSFPQSGYDDWKCCKDENDKRWKCWKDSRMDSSSEDSITRKKKEKKNQRRDKTIGHGASNSAGSLASAPFLYKFLKNWKDESCNFKDPCNNRDKSRVSGHKTINQGTQIIDECVDGDTQTTRLVWGHTDNTQTMTNGPRPKGNPKMEHSTQWSSPPPDKGKRPSYCYSTSSSSDGVIKHSMRTQTTTHRYKPRKNTNYSYSSDSSSSPIVIRRTHRKEVVVRTNPMSSSYSSSYSSPPVIKTPPRKPVVHYHSSSSIPPEKTIKHEPTTHQSHRYRSSTPVVNRKVEKVPKNPKYRSQRSSSSSSSSNYNRKKKTYHDRKKC